MAGIPNRALRSQRGVVLLIALIILVAMTLAGIGMMRSVDTGSVIAGNMAFKQATLLASDAGVNAAFNTLTSVANSANGLDKNILNYDNGQPCTNVPGATAAGCNVPGANINLPGYFSTPINPCEVTGQTTGNVNGTACTTAWQLTPWWSVAANWNGAPTAPPVTDPTNGASIASVQYLIHRMCQLPNATPGTTPTTIGASTQLCQSESEKCGKGLCGTLFLFRITSRSVGVRNTVTYTQSMAKIDMQ